jgi:hypothetical protein
MHCIGDQRQAVGNPASDHFNSHKKDRYPKRAVQSMMVSFVMTIVGH